MNRRISAPPNQPVLKSPPKHDCERIHSAVQPVLRFSPYAWAKLQFLRDLGPTEVGGFGISAADDLSLIVDVQLIRERCTGVTVHFEDMAVADFFDRQIDVGLRPEQFARVWVHTHPAGSALPSHVDEETFARVFGHCDWAVMFILARWQAPRTTGIPRRPHSRREPLATLRRVASTYARLRYGLGLGGQWEISVEVDVNCAFAAADPAAWEAEYTAHVEQEEFALTGKGDLLADWPDDMWSLGGEFLESDHQEHKLDTRPI